MLAWVFSEESVAGCLEVMERLWIWSEQEGWQWMEFGAVAGGAGDSCEVVADIK